MSEFKPSLMDFSERLHIYMTSLGLRQVDLVKATGASKGSVSGWLKGLSKPKNEKLLALAKLFNVTPDTLLSGDAFPHIGERIKERREALSLSQEDIARGLGISRVSVSHWERGSVPSSAHINELSALLQCPVSWLLGGDDLASTADILSVATSIDARLLLEGLEALHRERQLSYQVACKIAKEKGFYEPKESAFGLGEVSEAISKLKTNPIMQSKE